MKSTNILLAQGSGKLGGIVVQQDKHGEMVIRERIYRKPARSALQIEQQIQFKADSQSWKMLSEQGRQSYRQLAAQMTGKTGKPMQGSNCYASITATRALMGLDPLPIAPALPLQSPMTPSSGVSLAAVNADGVFSLLLVSEGAAAPFLLEASPAVSAGVASFKASAFRICETLGTLSAPQMDITSAFLDCFAAAPAGTQVAIRLTPLTETGFRGTPKVYAASVASSAEAMTADLEARQAKAPRRGQLKRAA